MQVTSFKVDNVVSVPYVRMNPTDDVLAWVVSDCYDVSDAHPINSSDSGVKINSPLGIIAKIKKLFNRLVMMPISP